MDETKTGDELNGGAHEKDKEEHRAPWLQWLALSTALFAVLAAIASLKSGQLANESLLRMNEATLRQAQASDAWSYYQAKGIKEVTREAESDLLSASGAPVDAIAKVRAEADRHKTEQDDIQKQARGLEQERQELADKSQQALERSHRLAYAVTVLQVAIGLSAIAALTQRRGVWLIALVGGIIGTGLLFYSLI